MIQPATSLTPTPPTGRIKAAPGTVAPEAFAASLTTFLDANMSSGDSPAPVSGKVEERQPDADSGKGLPDQSGDTASAFAWMPVPVGPVPISPEPIAAPVPTVSAQPTVVAAVGTSALTPIPTVTPASSAGANADMMPNTGMPDAGAQPVIPDLAGQAASASETDPAASGTTSAAPMPLPASIAPDGPAPGVAPPLAPIEPTVTRPVSFAAYATAPSAVSSSAITSTPNASLAAPRMVRTSRSVPAREPTEQPALAGSANLRSMSTPTPSTDLPGIAAPTIAADLVTASSLQGAPSATASTDMAAVAVPSAAGLAVPPSTGAATPAMPSSGSTTPPVDAPLLGTMAIVGHPIIVAAPIVASAAPPPLRTAAATDAPMIASKADLPIVLVQPAPLAFAMQPQPGTVAPALHVFGAAISAARKQDDRTAIATTDATPIGITSAPLDMHRHAVTATAEAQQAPLDMRQDRWPSAMIDRIEQLRDSADANDTRIRLVPDALGAIDVSVKRDGDSVHVHFNAEQAATQTLLNDAQPRLAELAAARGLKLTQGSVDSGATGNGQQRGAFQQSPLPAAPPRAVRDEATDSTDTRIA